MSANASSTAASVGNFLQEGFKVMFYLKSPHELALTNDSPTPKYLLDYGVPMFFVLMIIEWIGLAVRDYFGGHRNANTHGGERPHTFYRLNDMIVSTTIGSVQTVFVFFYDIVGIWGSSKLYQFVYDNYRLADICLLYTSPSPRDRG